ncbi:hypothetical protein TeGR_g8042 [Tetraparma gracilis]|uniref:Uncharacterized protein n=1 Tax=Tetraparma gracilis TaxID=2962635 RepID=A0ABQ6MJQ9_9STRA|nr:hypothetical protein TeGR_g8042 [Tetraparma gracilis]
MPAPSALLLYRHADVHVRRLLLHTPAAMEVLAVTRDGDLCSIDGFDKELGEYELERESDGSALSLPASSILLFAASPSTPEPLLSLLDLHARCLLNACRLLQKLAASPPSPDPLPGPDGPLYFALDVAQPLLKLCLLATAAVTSHYNKSPANSQDVHLWLTAHYLKARTHYLLRRFPQCLSAIAAGLALGEERGSPSNLIPALADLREKAEAGRERERKRDKRTAKAIGKHVMAVMEKSKTPLPELEG